jgi:hypothetical protein
VLAVLVKAVLDGTSGSLFLDVALQDPIESFASHLAREHETNFNLAITPHQSHVDDDQSLGHEGQPCTQV